MLFFNLTFITILCISGFAFGLLFYLLFCSCNQTQPIAVDSSPSPSPEENTTFSEIVGMETETLSESENNVSATLEHGMDNPTIYVLASH